MYSDTIWARKRRRQAIVRLVLMALLGLWGVAMFGVLLLIGGANFDYTNSMNEYYNHDSRVVVSWMLNGCR